MKPIQLGPNQPPRFYRGGSGIAKLRGSPWSECFAPEDWVASTTTLFGRPSDGLTRLPDGQLLRAAIAADPIGYLGRAHTERYGPDPALLVKLLDAGERLPVHCHPGRDFAHRHLGCRYGKTEAWIVVGTAGPGATVHLGFRRPVDTATVAGWVSAQDTDVLLGALNRVEVTSGDAILVPAGLPHAIGAGVLLVELQEPTDLSVLLEWDGFALDGAAEGHLGLGPELALSCLDTSGWDRTRLAGLCRAAGPPVRGAPVRLLPPQADGFFRAERIRPNGKAVTLAPSFAVLVVLDGAGWLVTEEGAKCPLRRGDTVLVPHGAGRAEVWGPVDAIRCLPPDPRR
jgi:mannose-6-phosphate isomerase